MQYGSACEEKPKATLQVRVLKPLLNFSIIYKPNQLQLQVSPIPSHESIYWMPLTKCLVPDTINDSTTLQQYFVCRLSIFIILLRLPLMYFVSYAGKQKQVANSAITKPSKSSTSKSSQPMPSNLYWIGNFKSSLSLIQGYIVPSVSLISRGDYFCIPCFATFQIFPPEYAVRQSLRWSPTNSSWDLMDQVILVSAFSIWGYSNWAQIKDYMDYNGSPFSLSEIQHHFQTYHYNQPTHLLPFPENRPVAQPRPLHGQNALKLYQQALQKVGQLKRRDSKGQKKISSMKIIPNLQADSQRMIKPPSNEEIKIRVEEQARNTGQMKNECSVLGYNPKRGQFQYIYYDLEAEKMLQQLEFYDEDTPQEYQLKIKLIENYNLRLDQRAKRKQFTLQYKLLDSHYQFSQKADEQRAAAFFEPVMRFTNNLQEYRSLIGESTTLANYQKFINILNKIRRSVSRKGDTLEAFEYLSNKRNKSIEQWQRMYNKKYKDKKRRRIHYKKSLEQKQQVIGSQMQQQLEQSIDFDFYSASLLQFMNNPNPGNTSLKIAALGLPKKEVIQNQRQQENNNEIQDEQAKFFNVKSE